MTDEGQPSAPQGEALAPGKNAKSREILVWVFSPLLLLIGAGLVALVLGAPFLRATVVFALIALVGGAYLLYRPHPLLPIGKVRSGSLIYSGVGALVLALAFSSAGSPPSGLPATPTGARVADAPPRPPPPPQRRSFYPWAYTVSPLTLTCKNSAEIGAGEVIATSEDGRVFGVSENAVSTERPNIETLQRTSGSRDEVRAAAATLTQAGLGLCLGTRAASQTLIASEGAPPPPPPSSWIYNSNVDEMSDQPTAHACTMSTNMVQLGFPYETQRVSLCLRQHPRWGQDVIVRLERGGQFLCTSYQACTVRVRFDDGEAAAYSALEPSDNSSDTIFITNDARFIGNLRRSSRVIIEANFYQAGAQRMSFDAGQLEWPPRS